MAQRLLAMATTIIAISVITACGDDSSLDKPGFDAGPSDAGSCNFPDRATCDEYAGSDANSARSAECGAAGGEWTGGKCPFDERMAVCVVNPPASRTYAYTEEAAASLMDDCAGSYNEILEVVDPNAGFVPADSDDAGQDDDAGR